MITKKISLNSIDKIRSLVSELLFVPYNVDLKSGRYVVDAKSIMGIFSLDLSKPLEIIIYSDDCDRLLEYLKDYILE